MSVSKTVNHAVSLTKNLTDVWYAGALSSHVKTGAMLSQVILQQPILFYRNQKGEACALRNLCPHRGIPLSYGRIVNDEVECPYHGWKFNCEGVCTEIPSLLPDQDVDSRKIKVKKYPVIEMAGIVWIFIDQSPRTRDAAKVPRPFFPNFPANIKVQSPSVSLLPLPMNLAAAELLNPLMSSGVHRKKDPHFWDPVSSGLKLRQTENKKVETHFHLPAVRIDSLRLGQQTVYSTLGALTPVDDKTTLFYRVTVLEATWARAFAPLLKLMSPLRLSKKFRTGQQGMEGMEQKHNEELYLSLTTEFIASRGEVREFQNPISETPSI